MIQQLQIKNFKAWQDTGTIEMSPITLFFGANSSGKSSIGQFLMMLKQTVQSSDRKAVFNPGGKNSAAQLGSYREMVFNRELKNKIEFEYKWSLDKALKVRDPVSGTTFSGDTLVFQAVVGMSGAHEDLLAVELFQYKLINKGSDVLSVGLKRKPGTKFEYQVESEQYDFKRKKMRVWTLKEAVRFYGFPDELVAYYQNADFVQELNLMQERLFNSIYYLGPLRSKAERLYRWGGINPESVGYSGENAIATILAGRGRKIGLVKSGAKRASKTLPIEEIIAQKLKEMGLIEEFSVQQLSEQRQEYEVRVRTRGARDSVDLPDVGFGISQVLPVLVQCFYAPPGSIIIMEQPEIHLHPSAQSALADAMTDVINSKENGKDRNIQLIIETHSEYFLKRLQRRIAEDSITTDRVSTYFADNGKSPSTLEALQIDTFGNIKNWPKNFFGDGMGDMTAHAKATMKKRIAQSENNEGS
ncbi:MAG: DUF3696 domain-containing protein [Candidatus Sabulitectum sp.]|nr:DUF3696 domain-containing protein [Candidatus Sabulitectum sp.]